MVRVSEGEDMHKFRVGETVHYVNPQGVDFGNRKIIGLDERTGRPTYYIEPTDTPWFSVGEESFTFVNVCAEDLQAARALGADAAVRGDPRSGWDKYHKEDEEKLVAMAGGLWRRKVMVGLAWFDGYDAEIARRNLSAQGVASNKDKQEVRI